MMNKYLIFRAQITGMGGGQMYVRNKAIYAERKGYKAYIISSASGEIIIYDLKKYANMILEPLKISPQSYTRKQREMYIEKILHLIEYSTSDRLVIESNDVIMSLWGELIAKKTSGKHLAFILNEEYSKENKHYIKYFEFKHARKELAGITDHSLEKLFEGYKQLAENEKYHLSAMCTNVVDDCENPIIDKISKEKIVIGSIGRLNKKYVPSLCDELCEFVNNHHEIEFQIIFIGDSPNDKDIRLVESKLENCKNVEFLITGYMFPIPKSLFPMINVFISSAGSARVSYRQQRPTISIDAETYKAIGIVGYNTENKLYSTENDQPCDIHIALEKVLYEKVVPKYEENAAPTLDTLEEHDKFLSLSSNDADYFDVNTIPLSKYEVILKICVLLFGADFTSKVIFPRARRLLKRKNG